MMNTTLDYVARTPLLEKEKCFDTDFVVDSIKGARRSNLVFEPMSVTVQPIVNRGDWNIDKNGFCIIKAKTGLSAKEAFEKTEETKKAYWYEIEALLHEKFPQYARIESYDFTVSIRCTALYRCQHKY
jgi:hypothetical protein